MLLDKLAVTDPGDRDARDAHSPSRGRDTDKVACVGSLHGKPRHDAVFLLHVSDRDPQIREPGGERYEVFLVALKPGDDLRRIETSVVGRDEAFDAAGVFVVPDLLDMLAENSLGYDMISFR